MALKSSREGLRKELVDYLGNIIIDENLKQNIINSIDDVFINNEELTTSVNELDEKIRNETSARESADTNLSDIKANKSDVLTLEEIQASTDLSGKIASASGLKEISTKVAGIDSVFIIGHSGEDNAVKFTPRNIGTGVFLIYTDSSNNIIGLLSSHSTMYRILYANAEGFITTTGSIDDTVAVNNGGWYSTLYARKIA